MNLPLLLILVSLTNSSLAHLHSNAFPGYGFSWYDPACGYACHDAISSATLSCSEMMDMGEHQMSTTSAQCYASNKPFLTTLAYCMNSTCDPTKVPVWKREQFWSTKMTGDPSVVPKWSYSQALVEITERPTIRFDSESTHTLNQTMVVDRASYDIQSSFMVMFDHLEELQATYIFVLLTIGFGTPIFFTLLARLPFMTGVIDKVKPYLVYPSTIGTYHVRPLPWLLGNAPTLGQALYIAMFFILNLVLSCVNYDRSQPMPWGYGPREELLAYIGYRTGHIAYALLPLLILFAGRNNFLLWVTHWSYSTYVLLHRWIARIFAVHAIVHSITLLLCYQGSGGYAEDHNKPFWLWGIVATVLTCAMLVFSHLYFRRLAYEAFLILHILLAVFVIAGCWYHVVLQFGFNFYDNWLYAACSVWFFDRLLRVLRMAKNGVRRATVTEVGPDYVRVDVPSLRWVNKPGYVAYAHFPTVSPLRPWENHPFSCNSTAIFRSSINISAPSSTSLEPSSSEDGRDIEKSVTKVSQEKVLNDTAVTTGGVVGTAGVTFIIKKNAGLTKMLKSHNHLITLLDGPYRQNPSSGIMNCDRVLLIGGGIGITGIIAWTRAHPNVKLAWSVRSSAQALVREFEAVLKDVPEKEVLVGERLRIEDLLRSEAEAGYSKVGVVVCGPGGMCDAVRATVAGLGRGSKTLFELEVDAFSW